MPLRWLPVFGLTALALLGSFWIVQPVEAQAATPEPPTARVCTPPTRPEPKNEEERAERERWAEYRLRLQEYVKLLPTTPNKQVLMPVRGVRVSQVADTFGAPRGGGRRHEGQDIFARKGTPVYAATEGYVWRMGYGQLGGLYVFVAGPGGRRYYYAHLDSYAKNLREGQKVTTRTLLGYVGNTGNARTTPAHLHFGVYTGSRSSCDYKILDPLPMLTDRNWGALAEE